MTATTSTTERELGELAAALGGRPCRVSGIGQGIALGAPIAAAIAKLLDPVLAPRIHALALATCTDDDACIAFVPFDSDDIDEATARAAILVASAGWGLDDVQVGAARLGHWKSAAGDAGGDQYACHPDDPQACGMWWMFDLEPAVLATLP